MTAHDATTEINATMERLCDVPDTIGKRLADKTCRSSEAGRMSELHDRVALAIAADRRGK